MTKTAMTKTAIVADIGGTNSRFGIVEIGSHQVYEIKKYANSQYPSLADVLDKYQYEIKTKADSACIAVACPIIGDEVKLTNNDWQFSIKQMREHFAFEQLNITNDFTALAMSLPFLPKEDVQKIGGGEGAANKPIGVLGPGTGLGVSGVFFAGEHMLAIMGEGGHIGFAPFDEYEIEILKIGMQKYGFVSMERILCGTGMRFLYEAMAKIDGHSYEDLSAKEITRRAIDGGCQFSNKVLHRFCAILGSAAGDHALTLGAFGGIYIGGGIIPQIGDFFLNSEFRARFEAKDRFTDYVKKIPTFVISAHNSAALIGAAMVLSNA